MIDLGHAVGTAARLPTPAQQTPVVLPLRPRAALHEHLHQVAGTARAMFEAALVRVAQADGIPLPAAPVGA